MSTLYQVINTKIYNKRSCGIYCIVQYFLISNKSKNRMLKHRFLYSTHINIFMLSIFSLYTK